MLELFLGYCKGIATFIASFIGLGIVAYLWNFNGGDIIGFAISVLCVAIMPGILALVYMFMLNQE